jgi:hypothetical protein
VLAGVLLEVAADHFLPALLSELGEYAVRRASRAVFPTVQPTLRAADSDVLSHVPGRLRVRVPDVRGNVARARQLERCLGLLTGVRRTQASALTGTVLVEYDPDQARAEDIYATVIGRQPCEAS